MRTALDLYIRLAELGVTLTPTGEGGSGIQVRPWSALSAEQQQAVRTSKPDLLHVLSYQDETQLSLAWGCYLTLWQMAFSYGATSEGIDGGADDAGAIAAARTLADRIVEQLARGYIPGGRRVQHGEAS